MPYELSYFTALLSFFCVYAVDTVGHPGKSSQTAVSHIIVAENDIVFPSKKILAKAEKLIPNLKTHILKGQGQKFALSDVDIDMIARFINE
jgi:hypothetical protein